MRTRGFGLVSAGFRTPGFGLAGGGGGAFSPEQLFGGTATEGYWPTNGDTSMFQDEAKSTPATGTDLVAVIESKGGGPDLTIASGLTTLRPNRDESGLLDFFADGSGRDYLQVSLSTRGTDMVYMAVMNTLDAGFYLGLSSSTAVYFGRAADGDATENLHASSGTPVYYINGALFTGTTRNELRDAIAIGSDVIVEVTGLDFSDTNWAVFKTGLTNLVSYALDGLQGYYVLMENPGESGLTQIREFLADRRGITL